MKKIKKSKHKTRIQLEAEEIKKKIKEQYFKRHGRTMEEDGMEVDICIDRDYS